MDGTRSYLVGRETLAVIDPGPDVETHVRALASRLLEASEAKIVLTHGHRDHAAAALALAAATGARIHGPTGTDAEVVLTDGDAVETDEGRLVAVHTPGHTENHLCFHWPERGALFAGDLLLGKGDTTWVAEYPGCIADYLRSLQRLRTLDLSVIYPAHGPPLENPTDALDRFEAHRRTRIRQVEEAMRSEPQADLDRLLQIVYGESLPPGLEAPARRSLGALRDHVRDSGGK